MAIHGYILLSSDTISVTGTSYETTNNGGISFSAVSAINVDSIFSVEYDNYLIMMEYKGSTGLDLTMQMRDSGSDVSLTNYNYQSLTADDITIAGARTTGATSFPINTTAGNLTCSSMIYVYAPYKQLTTGFYISSCSDTSSAYLRNYAASYATTSLFDGFNIKTSTGTITGTMSIYGAKK